MKKVKKVISKKIVESEAEESSGAEESAEESEEESEDEAAKSEEGSGGEEESGEEESGEEESGEEEEASTSGTKNSSEVQEKVYFYTDWDDDRLENFTLKTHTLQDNRKDGSIQKFSISAHGQIEGTPNVITEVDTRINICYQDKQSHTLGEYSNRSGLSKAGFRIAGGSIEGDYGGVLGVLLEFPNVDQLLANWNKVRKDFKKEEYLTYREYKPTMMVDSVSNVLALSMMFMVKAHKYYDICIAENDLYDFPKLSREAFEKCIIFLRPMELTEFTIKKTVPMSKPILLKKGEIEIMHKNKMPLFYNKLRGDKGFGSTDEKKIVKKKKKTTATRH